MPRGRPHLTSNFPMISRGSSYPEENDRDIRGAIHGDQTTHRQPFTTASLIINLKRHFYSAQHIPVAHAGAIQPLLHLQLRADLHVFMQLPADVTAQLGAVAGALNR